MNCLKQMSLVTHLPQALSLLYDCNAVLWLQITALFFFL